MLLQRKNRRRLTAVVGNVELIRLPVAIRDERLDGSLARIVGEVRDEGREYFRNRLDPQHVEIVTTIELTLLPYVRADMHDAAHGTQEAIRIAREPAAQPSEEFHRRAA